MVYSPNDDEIKERISCKFMHKKSIKNASLGEKYSKCL